MSAVKKFRQSGIERQPGELGRLKVVQGPDVGAVYVIDRPNVAMGRGEENDLIVSDLKASRRHGNLSQTAQGWVLRDGGSANGIVVNGVTTREALLRSGDVITVGETHLEFQSGEMPTRILQQPARSLEEVVTSRENLQKQVDRVRLSVNAGTRPAATGARAVSNDAGSDGRRGLILVVFVAAAAWMVAGEDSSKGKKESETATAGTEVQASRNLASLLPRVEDSQVAKKSEEFFRAGFREFTAGNYLRAKTQFETVLQIYPAHEMANRYLEKCRLEMNRAAKDYLTRGKNALDAGKLKEAENNFNAVLRLYYSDQRNEHFVTAQAHLEELSKRVGRGGSP